MATKKNETPNPAEKAPETEPTAEPKMAGESPEAARARAAQAGQDAEAFLRGKRVRIVPYLVHEKTDTGRLIIGASYGFIPE